MYVLQFVTLSSTIWKIIFLNLTLLQIYNKYIWQLFWEKLLTEQKKNYSYCELTKSVLPK